ncbi:MAG: hypothetical protein SPI72_03400 [Porphyromonas sp.]|nr:hypothetical protein [Porphyromonas sp.]
MEYYGNKKVCISVEELTRDNRTTTDRSDSLAPIISKDNYHKMCQRGRITVVRAGKGKGNYALVDYESLPDDIKWRVKEKYGHDVVALCVRKEDFAKAYELDVEARQYYSEYRFADGGILPLKAQEEYTINASVLKTIIYLYGHKKQKRKLMQGALRTNWGEMVDAVRYYKEETGHTLPETASRLSKRVREFKEVGYESLISGKFRNQSARKVDYRTERLLQSLAALPNRPFYNHVSEMYDDFRSGELEVVNPETGMLFNPADFKDLSYGTVRSYLERMRNKILLMKEHETTHDYNAKMRPHHLRKSPEYSFSKVSFDDRDLPRKMKDGNRVKAYYVYDVTSGAVIGYAYNRKKNRDLVLECFRSMFRLIDRQGWGVPAQVEVEHHLMSEHREGLLQAGIVFPFVRWCNPTNSQEKRAEHFNGAKKKTVEKRNHTGIGRWWSRSDNYRIATEKVFDEDNDKYTEGKTYTYDELVSDDIRDLCEYNGQLHPNQKKYPGMTRWQVLEAYLSPNLAPIDKAVLYRYIGERTETSIRRNMYLQVAYEQFILPSPDVLDLLAPHTTKVEAYYLPEEDGEIKEVYIYQGECYLGCCSKVVRYNEANSEWTEADEAAYQEQAAYVAQFDAKVRRERIDKVEIIKKQQRLDIEAIEAEEIVLPKGEEIHSPALYDMRDWANKALQDF